MDVRFGVIHSSPSAASADDQDPHLEAAIRLVLRRRRWGWTALWGFLAARNTATFVPQSYAESCSYHGNGDCSTITVGILKAGSGGVRSTWPHEVPIGHPFEVRRPVWTWGPGSALIDGDGIAVGAALISLLFDGLTVLGAIFFVKVVRSRLGRLRRAALAGRPS